MQPHRIPDSLPGDSLSQKNHDHGFEPTQLSQPRFSQTQNTQGTQFANSQVEPRRKYWAVLIPTNTDHSILKIPWTRANLQVGRGPYALARNDIVLQEKRISNVHCRITLGLQGVNGSGTSSSAVQTWKEGEGEPDVWIEDLGSSNGTFVNGEKVLPRRMLRHGDEISLGHVATLDNHDVRYIFRSVGRRGAKLGYPGNRGMLEAVGEVYERYQILDRLGKGSFAEVRKAVDVETGDLRAIKQIVKHRFAGNKKTLELFQREIDICQRLQHENICRLVEWFEDPQHICLVLEYVDGGDLLDHIMNYPGHGLPEDYAARLAYQICSAMAYTHAMGVTHRDLKPENILLTLETAETPVTVKIADFGLAKMVEAGTMLKSMVGTPQYLAPEVVMQNKQKPGYENKVDSWSVGIIVYSSLIISMLTKALPFDEDAELPVDQRIKMRFTQAFDTNLLHNMRISQSAVAFIDALLAKTPENRYSMSQALEHAWLSETSSQAADSQPNRLCGDSVWSIESFDSGYSDDASDDARWQRPMTASGTNFGGDSHVGSDNSFSQPMHNLHLQTPATTKIGNGYDRSTRSPPLPSPPLTDERAVSNGTTMKRKTGESGLFSSGSLTPPPGAVPATEQEPEQADAPLMRSPSPQKPRRESLRNIGRPRKSMRIA